MIEASLRKAVHLQTQVELMNLQKKSVTIDEGR